MHRVRAGGRLSDLSRRSLSLGISPLSTFSTSSTGESLSISPVGICLRLSTCPTQSDSTGSKSSWRNKCHLMATA